jgi:hypothetical protein
MVMASSSSSEYARNKSGAIGSSVENTTMRTSAGPKGTTRICRMTPKLPARSFNDLPQEGRRVPAVVDIAGPVLEPQDVARCARWASSG